MRLQLTVLAAAIAFVLAALASQIDASGTHATAATPEPHSRPGATSMGYASLVAGIDARIEGLRARANDRPRDWLTRKHLATVLLERASLTQQLDDFQRVEAVLDEAFTIAPEGSGPLMLAARFNFAIHRLDVAEDYLDRMDRRALQRHEEQVAARVLRAEIALQRGQYEVAFAGLTEVAAMMPEAATVELALYHAKTGNPEQAEALLQDALASSSDADPRRRAWTSLQLGLLALDRGVHFVALQHLRAADAELPGWWLVREHIAEVHERVGDHAEAIAIYDDLVRTAGLPHHMDALARAYRHAGEPERTEDLITRSSARWQEHLARFPEAAMGHGLAHELEFGTPEAALALAEKNYATRPGGDAHVSLARACLQSGEPDRALALAERALATPYRTAALHDVAARAHAALGHTAAAAAQLELRAAIHPSYDSQAHTH